MHLVCPKLNNCYNHTPLYGYCRFFGLLGPWKATLKVS